MKNYNNKNSKAFFKERALPWIKNNKSLFVLCSVAFVAVFIALVVGVVTWITQPRPFKYDAPQGSLTQVFGALFGINTELDEEQEASVMEGSRPVENLDIPYSETKLKAAFDMIDKSHLYIKGTSYTLASTGYMRVDRVYAVRNEKIYIMLDNGKEDYHLLSDGKQVVGLDFEKSTYTVTSPFPYTIDELFYTGGFESCTHTGTDVFFSKQLEYEDFTSYSSASRLEWVRYFFNDDGSLAGYARYINNDLNELMAYEYLSSDFPEDAVVYFKIPDGFAKEDVYIDWSEIFGEE